MPFLKKNVATRRHRSGAAPRTHTRRDEDSFILRGAEIIRQQLGKQDELNVSYYSKLDADWDQPMNLNTTSSYSSDERMDHSSRSPRTAGRGRPRRRPLRQRAAAPTHAPPQLYQSQSSDRSFPASTDDSLFTDHEAGAPPPPPSELDSSFSFLDDSEWADMQTTQTNEDLGLCSPAWSMPAKHVSDDEAEEEELEGLEIFDEYASDEGLMEGLASGESLTLDMAPSGCSACPAILSPWHAAPAQTALQAAPTRPSAQETFHVLSPLDGEYSSLLRDPAFTHAIHAGQCWQSLVGQLVRFPSSWWKGARGPPLGVASNDTPPMWQFYGRYRVWNNHNLKRLVPNRASPGLLLLHLIVQDLVTLRPVRDVVVGVFHPNARGIRRTVEPNLQDEPSRDVWLAVRKRDDTVSVVDKVLRFGKVEGAKSPLGNHHVNNHNMRAVFGDHPPMDTMFLPEDILYQRLSLALETCADLSPAEVLLQEFVFEQ